VERTLRDSEAVEDDLRVARRRRHEHQHVLGGDVTPELSRTLRPLDEPADRARELVLLERPLASLETAKELEVLRVARGDVPEEAGEALPRVGLVERGMRDIDELGDPRRTGDRRPELRSHDCQVSASRLRVQLVVG
jgi:hypothetical protein